jgi:hypothetical protein
MIKREAGRLHGARGLVSRVIFRKLQQAESHSYFWEETAKLTHAAAE